MAMEKWLVDEPKVIDTGIVRRLRVGLVGGQVDVVAHDEPTARVEVHSVSGKSLKVEVDGDTLTVDHPQIRWDDPLGFLKSFRGKAQADVSILVPYDAVVTVGVVSAGALVSGVVHGANVHTVSGAVVVDGVTGDLQINAVSGDASVRDHRGAVTVRTVSGDVAGTGRITRFSSDGVSGDVLLDIEDVPDTARVHTVSGAVSVRLEHDTPYEAAIGTASGTLQFDDEQVRGIHGAYTKRSGRLEGQWFDLRVNTVSGDVAVLHAAAPAAGSVADEDEVSA